MELHALLDELVGADDEVHPALGEIGEDALLLLGRREAGEDLDGHRKGAEAALGRGVVLLGKDRGGDQDGGLLAVQDALHHRPEGHLRLAVAHVAAEEAVHGPGLFHVGLDLPDGTELVLRLLVGEGVLKLLLPGRVRGEGEARLPGALGVELDEALGQVLDGGLGPGALLGPLGAAQLIEPGLLLGVFAAADILADHVQLGHGDIEAVAAGVVQLDVVLFHPVRGQAVDAREAADAVVDVDHQVPGL